MDITANCNPAPQKVAKRPKGWGARHTTAILGFWAMCILYALRFNLSIAIVAMVRSNLTFSAHQVNGSGSIMGMCSENLDFSVSQLQEEGQSAAVTPKLNNSKKWNLNIPRNRRKHMGEFSWSRKEQGLILSSFFWGHVFTQIPGGMLAQAYGPKWPLGFGIFSTAVLTLLTPVAARFSVNALILVRVLMGLVGGVVWPAMHLLLGKWAPKDERSKLVSIVYAGPQFGAAAATVACGYLIDADVMGGWSSAFYVLGSVSLLWCFFWCFFAFNTPREHPRILTAELEYIESSIGEASCDKRVPTPWKEIFTSVPLWAIMIAHIGEDWGLYTLLTELPAYLDTVLHFNIRLNSWMSALPQIARWAFAIGLTYFADCLIHKNILSVVTVRKLCNTIGHWGAAIGLVAVSYLGCDPTLAATMLVITVGINGAVNGGCITNHVDISPNHAGILMGITNTAANVCGIVAPVVAGYITNEGATIDRWQLVFFIAAGIYVIDNIIYIIFASGTEQKWNRADPGTVSSIAYVKRTTSNADSGINVNDNLTDIEGQRVQIRVENSDAGIVALGTETVGL